MTDQLEEWWEYIGTQEVKMRSTEFNQVEGRPHHGFIAIDPEGYYLEWDVFADIPVNADLVKMIAAPD